MDYPPKPLWAPTDSLASLLGTYRFTGKPFWWSFGTTTDSLASFRGFKISQRRGFFFGFFFAISDPPENNSGTTSAEPEVHSPCLIATHHLYPHTSMTFRPLPITTCSQLHCHSPILRATCLHPPKPSWLAPFFYLLSIKSTRGRSGGGGEKTLRISNKDPKRLC